MTLINALAEINKSHGLENYTIETCVGIENAADVLDDCEEGGGDDYEIDYIEDGVIRFSCGAINNYAWLTPIQ